MQKTDSSRVATQPVGSYRKASAALLSAAVLFVSSLSAQDNVLLRPEDGGVAPSLHYFGDTTKHNVRVLSFNPQQEFAQVYMRSPKNYIVLAVVPGKDIEVIAPGDLQIGPMGKNLFAMFMHRYEISSVRGRATSSNDRQAYEACQRRRANAVVQQAADERARRESAKKGGSGAPPMREYDTEMCEMPSNETQGVNLVRRQLGLRPEAERYLVVITSSDKINAAELDKRLRALTTTATTVAQTIEGIAAGIFAGHGDTYGGVWVDW